MPPVRLFAIFVPMFCCRDFTNPVLPWGDPEWPMINALLPSSGSDGGGNVLTINFDNMTYPVTVDGLHTVSTSAIWLLHS